MHKKFLAIKTHWCTSLLTWFLFLVYICSFVYCNDSASNLNYQTTNKSLEFAPGCSGNECLLYVAYNRTDCPDPNKCYSSLNHAVDDAISNTRIIILGDVVYVNGMISLSLLSNVSIEAQTKSTFMVEPNATSPNSPIILIQDSVDILIRNITISRMKSKTSLISIEGSTAVFVDMSFLGNRLVIRDEPPTSNLATIFFIRNSNVRIQGIFAFHNMVHILSSDIVATGGCMSVQRSTIAISNSNFTHNQVTGYTSYGGAIYSFRSTLLIDTTIFLKNKAVGDVAAHGSAIWGRDTSLVLNSCLFVNNSMTLIDPVSEGSGGAISLLSKQRTTQPLPAYFHVSNTTFEGNNMRGSGFLQGGAVSADVQSIIITNCTFTRNIIGPALFTQEVSGRKAISSRAGALRAHALRISISDCQFDKNIVEAPTGYVPGWAYAGATELLADGAATEITVRNCDFMDNRATAGSSAEESAGGNTYGGALRISGSNVNVLISNCTFDRNVANGGDGPNQGGNAEGGALHVLSIGTGLELTLLYTTFYNNKIYGGWGNTTGGDVTGAAVYLETRISMINLCDFQGNKGQGGSTFPNTLGGTDGGYSRGGAVFLHSISQNTTFLNTRFMYNFAYGGNGTLIPNTFLPLQFGRGGMAYGGAVAAWGDNIEGQSTFLSCTFISNGARGGYAHPDVGVGLGGALWAYSLTAKTSTFESNQAVNGGAIYAYSVTVLSSNFSSNRANATTSVPSAGGAIYAFISSIMECYFYSNSAGTSVAEKDTMGGAIHSLTKLDVDGCFFEKNSANGFLTNSFGGAISSITLANIRNSTFLRNFALSQAVCPLDLTENNQSSETGHLSTRAFSDIIRFNSFGGAIWLDSVTNGSSLVGLVIADGISEFGGGIYVTGPNASSIHLSDTIFSNNYASASGAGLAYLPSIWDRTPLSKTRICQNCVWRNNSATLYGNDLVGPYSKLIASVSPVIYPGLPFDASFLVIDYANNSVKNGNVFIAVYLTSRRNVIFQSGSVSNTRFMNATTGTVVWPKMTIWTNPGNNASLKFQLSTDLDNFKLEPLEIWISFPVIKCPPGYRLDDSTSYVSCQKCIPGRYSFDSNECIACPDGVECTKDDDTISSNQNSSIYVIDSGFAPSPKINPVAILKCPFYANVPGSKSPISSCLPTTCITSCGPHRIVSNDLHGFNSQNITHPQNLTYSCTTTCDDVSCHPGHKGFLCAECVCDQKECYYAAYDQCLKCDSLTNFNLSMILIGITIVLLLFFKGSLLAILMALLGVIGVVLVFIGLVNPLIGGLFVIALIIFAETQKGTSSGLVKSFVFYIQTLGVLVTREVWPRQLSGLVGLLRWTQLHAFGMECISRALFGNSFRRFLFSMTFPAFILILMVCTLVISELLRNISFIKTLQDFDPLMKIGWCKKRLGPYNKSLEVPEYADGYSLLDDAEQPDSVSRTLSLNTLNSRSINSMAMLDSQDSFYGAGQSTSRNIRAQAMFWKLGHLSLFLLFAAHFELCTRILEVFAPCKSAPSEGFSYMRNQPWNICSTTSSSVTYFSLQSIHGQMVVGGIFFGLLYVIGIPMLFGGLLYYRRREIKAGDEATAQWLGLLYVSYRPSLHYFELAWLLRRILLAASISVIPPHLAASAIVPASILVISVLIQRRYKPFVSKKENNMEVLSMLTLILTLFFKILLIDNYESPDVLVWKWIIFILNTMMAGAYVIHLAKPLLKIFRTPKAD